MFVCALFFFVVAACGRGCDGLLLFGLVLPVCWVGSGLWLCRDWVVCLLVGVGGEFSVALLGLVSWF